jgi:hypothetical protein
MERRWLPATSRRVYASGASRREYSAVACPTKTPVRLPASEAGTIPASSSASHTTVSSSRCCGSSAAASAGAMPKKDGSKAKGSSRNPPNRETVRPGVRGSAE